MIAILTHTTPFGHFRALSIPCYASLRLNPNDPQAGAFLGYVALAHYHQENYEEAVHYGELGIRPRHVHFSLRTLLASLGQLGRTEEAKPLLGEYISLHLKDRQRLFEVTTPYLDLKYRDHLADGLRRAGAPFMQR